MWLFVEDGIGLLFKNSRGRVLFDIRNAALTFAGFSAKIIVLLSTDLILMTKDGFNYMDALKIILIILIFLVCIFCFTTLLFYISEINTHSPPVIYVFALITVIGLATIVFLIISLFPKAPGHGEGGGSTLSPKEPVSYFDGRALEWFGLAAITFFATVLSLGWAYPWARCMLEKWKAEHTVISGRRLKFKGKVKNLFVNHLIWSLLSVVTFGVYGIISYVEFEKWKSEQIHSEPDTGKKPPVKPKNKLIIIALIILIVELGVGIFLIIIFYNQIQSLLASMLPSLFSGGA